MKKRLSVFLLVLALLLQVLPAAVLADDVDILAEQDPLHLKYNAEDAPMLAAEADIEQADGRVTFADFSTRTLAKDEVLRYGVDVSQWQNDIDWAKVKADGVDFAIIRVGYRGYGNGSLYSDSVYQKNIEGALAAGIDVGVYVYSQAVSVEEAVEEAEFLIDRISDYDISLPLVLDYEFAGNGIGRLWKAFDEGKLDKESAAEVCQAFCDTVEEAGYDSMVYVNPDMAYNYVDVSGIERIWLAHYTSKNEDTGKYSATNYKGNYEFWQCSSNGKVDGISGRCDINFWFSKTTPFTDVDPSEWYYEDIKFVYENGMVNGMTETTYEPETHTTRGQLVTMLYRMVGKPMVSGEMKFTDLTADYYKTPVLWAYQNSIVNGRSETIFDPDSNISREDLATILYRMAGSPKTAGSLSKFTDAGKVSDYAKNALCWAVENGIVNGMTTTELAPQGSATRAQIAAMLHRYALKMDTDESADMLQRMVDVNFDDSVAALMELSQEEMRAYLETVLNGTVTPGKEPDDQIAAQVNSLYNYLLEHPTDAEEFLAEETWTLTVDTEGDYYLEAGGELSLCSSSEGISRTDKAE